MNIQGGGLSFEISGTNQNLMLVLEQSKRAIQQFSTDSVKGGKDIDAVFTKAWATIEKGFNQIDAIASENRKALGSLKAKYAELGEAAGKAYTEGRDKEYRALTQSQEALKADIRLREQVLAECERTADALVAEQQAMEAQREKAEKSAKVHQSLETQLRKVREELVRMEQAGERGTDKYRELQQEAGRLTDAWKDAITQSNILAHDQRGMQGLISGLTGLSGGFTATQGAVSLFVGENENLQKVMLKVQSLMSITIGLQQVEQMLNKDSAFRLVTVAKAKDMLTAANTRLAAALGISNVAAGALMATLTLGLSVAITAVIVLLSKLSSKQAEAKKRAEEFNAKVAETAGQPVAAYRALQTEWLALSGSLKDREKWVQDNANRFKDLGFRVTDAKEAEDVLINNSTKFVEACILKAKALAATNLAAEKYEEIIKKQAEIDAMPDRVKTFVQTGSGMYGGITGQYVEVDNKAKAKAMEELKEAQAAADELVKMQVSLTEEQRKALAEIGSQAGEIVAGSVTAAEKEFTRLQELYNNAGTAVERANIAKQIAAQQAKLDRISYKTTSSGSGKDPFVEQLNQRKTLYAKYGQWVTSSDETVRAAAGTEFAALLAEGTSYLDYLEKQRDALSNKAQKTAEDLKNLSAINNEIAETTKKTVIANFDANLQRELDLCQTISQRLELIAKRREELSGDNSDVDNAKAGILDEAESDTKKQAADETKALLQEYAGYLTEKLEFEESYARKKELLTTQAAKAATAEEKAIAEAALAALDKEKKKYENRSGSEAYDLLLQEYKTYEQKKTDILREYADQREEAEKQGNLAMISAINAKEQEELSQLAAQRLMSSESWNQLFDDLSDLSTKTISKLIADINKQKVTLSAQFDPSDLQAINEQLQKAENELHQRNPFLALKDSLAELRTAMRENKLLDSDDPFVKSLEEKKKQYQEYTDAVNDSDAILAGGAKEAYAGLLSEGSSYIDMLRRKIKELEKQKIELSLTVEGEEQLEILKAALNKETKETKSVSEGFKEVFDSAGSSLSFLSSSFDSVVGGIKKMGIAMDEETEAILGDIGGMLDGASQLASGIASGNPLGIIQGSVGLLSSAFSLFNTRDRKAEKSIKKHQDAVERLGRAYTALEHAVDSALGETVYQNQTAMIRNLRAQQREIQGMISDEQSKKKTDNDRVEEFREQYAEAGRQIDDLIAEITQSVTQTTAKDLAGELADALVSAFEEGKDAAEVFGDVANNVLKNAVVNALKLQFLEQPLQAAIKRLQKDMGFNEDGTGSFNGLTEAEQARFKDAVARAGENFQAAMDMYKDLFEQVGDGAEPTSLSGAIKGASQESIDLLAGQTNAVRQNQVITISIFRQQLQHLSNMDNTLGVISGRLLTIVNKLTTTTDDSLRSQGITD